MGAQSADAPTRFNVDRYRGLTAYDAGAKVTTFVNKGKSFVVSSEQIAGGQPFTLSSMTAKEYVKGVIGSTSTSRVVRDTMKRKAKEVRAVVTCSRLSSATGTVANLASLGSSAAGAAGAG